jgi:hypothetical protein
MYCAETVITKENGGYEILKKNDNKIDNNYEWSK